MTSLLCSSLYPSAKQEFSLTFLILFSLQPSHPEFSSLGALEKFIHQIVMDQRIESFLRDVIVMISRKSGLQTLPCRFVIFHKTSIHGFLVWVSVSTRYSFPQLLKTLSCLHLAVNSRFQKSVEFLSCVFDSFFVTDRASLFTDQRMGGLPIRAKYKHFLNHFLTYF